MHLTEMCSKPACIVQSRLGLQMNKFVFKNKMENFIKSDLIISIFVQ
jgi:hypothetical protein